MNTQALRELKVTLKLSLFARLSHLPVITPPNAAISCCAKVTQPDIRLLLILTLSRIHQLDDSLISQLSGLSFISNDRVSLGEHNPRCWIGEPLR